MTEPSIPHVLDSDTEDVAWGLQTADTLWKRNERIDAIVWLRRAAQSAGDAQDDDRAFSLARIAAELSDWVATNPVLPHAQAPEMHDVHADGQQADGSGVDELLSDIAIELSSDALEADEPEPEPEPIAPQPMAPLDDDESDSEDTTLAGPVPVEVMQRAARIQTIPEKPEATLPSFGLTEPSTQPSEISIVTVSERAPAVVFASVIEEPKDVKAAEEVHAGMLDPWAAAPEEPRIVRTPSTVVSDEDDEEVITSARLEVVPANARPPPPLPPMKRPETIMEDAAASELSASDDRTTPVPTGSDEEPAAPFDGTLDLSSVEGLADLPDDTKAQLAKVATIHRIARDEEISGFALAYVIEGEIDVAAQIVDAPADRLPKGALLRGKGTIAESVPLRLLGASESAIVATWDAEAIDPALGACPWVDDELRSAANRIQALVGVTLGPIADRLDTSIRNEITARFTVRELGEGEVFQQAGQAVKEMCIVGQGKLDLVKGDEVVGSIGVGEFAFPTQILGGGSAPTTARAAKGGALVLVAARAIAQELMVTCPPLLEIFAGM